MDVHAIAELQQKNIPITDDSFKYNYNNDGKFGLDSQYSMFLFFLIFFLDFEKCNGKILAIRKDGKFIEKLNASDEGVLILDKTCFYAEQGGQIYDTGVFTKIDDEVFFF